MEDGKKGGKDRTHMQVLQKGDNKESGSGVGGEKVPLKYPLKSKELYNEATLKVLPIVEKISHPHYVVRVGDNSNVWNGKEWVKNPEYDRKVNIMIQARMPTVDWTKWPTRVILIDNMAVFNELNLSNLVTKAIVNVIADMCGELFTVKK